MRIASSSPARSSLLRAVAVLAAAATLATLAPSTLAQPGNQRNQRDPNELNAPQPSPPNKTPATWQGTLVALALAGIVLGASVIPSKRGHQD